MPIFREIPPTAGFPFYASDLASLLKAKPSLEQDFKDYLGVPYLQVTYSGTAALYIILEGLKKISARKTVIIPSFVCPLVPLAIKRAGLEVKVCDINKTDFDFAAGQLQQLCSLDNDILAVIAVHLAGIAQDFAAIKEACARNAVFIIEDCAQSLGARYQGKKVGTLGDFGFFSLCRGKGATIYEGGAIAAKEEKFFNPIDDTIKRLVRRNLLSEGLKILELFGYWIFYRPLFFWYVWRLPQIFWEARGEKLKAQLEYFTGSFPLNSVSAFRKSLGSIHFLRLKKEIASQREKAFYYIENLKNTPGIRLITEPAGTEATYPYLTLLFEEPAKCKKARKVFRGSGLGVSGIYAAAITDYDYLKDITGDSACPNARYLAEREITLSTSAFLTKKDLDCIISKIKQL